MMTPEQREKLSAFMAGHPTAVLATCSNDEPAAAVVLFAHDDKFDIIFGTHPTRKYKNMQANPKVAMALTKDWSEIQLHGPVQELAGDEAEAAKQLFMAKHPEMDQHMMAGSVFFRLSPSWVRYMDTAQKPPEQWDVTIE